MRKILFLALIWLAFLLSGCGGGDPFVPPLGPYSGVFLVDGNQNGEFTFTTGDGLLAGTGYITHNGGPILVSISAVIGDHAINGQATNEQLGYGTFTGSFTSDETCNGTFTFTDTLETAVTTGTWTATLD